MTAQKIVLELSGKTLLIPPTAVFSIDSTVLQIYASNFSERVALKDIQRISLLDLDHATPTEIRLLAHLPGTHDHSHPSEKPSTSKSKAIKKKPKKETKLVSGMI